jgi:predicted HTH transcriptional regulator
MIEKSVIDALVGSPSESLNVEIKRWIDPTSPAGIEKIVKGTFALRNRNGGFFVIGFDDTTLLPDTANEPQNANELFHVDVIQGIVSRYASDPFEIEIAWGERDNRKYPIIAVPPGVKVPLAAKRDMMDGTRTAIRLGAVYFRSLASNGTPSTTEARPSDWGEIVEICFDNREADVGRFIRRL